MKRCTRSERGRLKERAKEISKNRISLFPDCLVWPFKLGFFAMSLFAYPNLASFFAAEPKAECLCIQPFSAALRALIDQYTGKLKSTSLAQRFMPPSRLYSFLNPCPCSSLTTAELRAPVRHWTIISRAVSSSPIRATT